MKIKSKQTALILTAIIAVSLLSTAFFISPSSAGSRTTTITASDGLPYVTRYETQRKVFQNPRGQKYYYALVTKIEPGLKEALRLYRSPDGENWINYSTIYTFPFFGFWESADLSFFENDAELVVYIVWTDYNGVARYCVVVINDTTAVPVVSDYYQIDFGDSIPRRYFNIEVDRRYYVWLTYYVEEPGSYLYDDLRHKASTEPKPGLEGQIYWSDEGYVGPAGQGPGYPTIVPLSGDGNPNVLIVYTTFMNLTQAGIIYWIQGTEVTWDGSTFTYPYIGEDCYLIPNSSGPELSAVRRSDGYVDVIFLNGSNRITHRVWNVSEGWILSSCNTVYSGSNVASLALSIDRTSNPDKLYAFYIRQTGKINYKTMSVSETQWSSEQEIVDGTESIDYLSSSYRDYNRRVQIIYTNQTSPYKIRFAITP